MRTPPIPTEWPAIPKRGRSFRNPVRRDRAVWYKHRPEGEEKRGAQGVADVQGHGHAVASRAVQGGCTDIPDPRGQVNRGDLFIRGYA